MQPAIHTRARTPRSLCIGLILASTLAAQPADIARRVAERESAAIQARANYTYRQSVTVEEMGKAGRSGAYTETRDIIFSPDGGRTEKLVGTPQSTLVRLRLTEEDFRDIREVQPFLFTLELLWQYEVRSRGEENLDGIACWVLSVRPRQVFETQRLFEGDLWVDQSDFSIVQSYGKAVPDLRRRKEENLFPRFTTFRERAEGGHRFPVHTHADDVLAFSSGPLRMRMTIRYSGYRRFDASSTVTFEK